MYIVEVASNAEPFWRFNLIVVCAGYNPAGEQLFLVSGESTIAEVGSNLLEPPVGYSQYREVTFETPSADNLQLIVYLIPHRLPPSRVVGDYPPFPIEVKVIRDGVALHASVEQINQWGGASLNITVQP